jgi:O-antigen ligase
MIAPIFALLLIPGVAQAVDPGVWVVWLALTLVTGWLVFLVAVEPGGVKLILGMLMLSALIQAVVAIWEFKTKHQLYLYSTSGSTATSGEAFFLYGSLIRPSGTLPDPIGLGQFLALCLPVSIAFAASLRRSLATIALICAAGLIALALALSLSRMSIVGGAVGVLLTLLLLPGRRRWLVAAGVLAVGVVVVALSVALGGSSFNARINSIVNPTAAHVRTAAGDIQREEIWKAAARIGEHHLLTGVGLGRVTEYLPKYGVPVIAAANAQNTPLQFFAEAGLLGLLAVVGIVSAAFVDIAKAARQNRLWIAGCLGGLIATLITWSTDVEVHYVEVSAMVAVLLGVIAAIRTISTETKQ